MWLSMTAQRAYCTWRFSPLTVGNFDVAKPLELATLKGYEFQSPDGGEFRCGLVMEGGAERPAGFSPLTVGNFDVAPSGSRSAGRA